MYGRLIWGVLERRAGHRTGDGALTRQRHGLSSRLRTGSSPTTAAGMLLKVPSAMASLGYCPFRIHHRMNDLAIAGQRDVVEAAAEDGGRPAAAPSAIAAALDIQSDIVRPHEGRVELVARRRRWSVREDDIAVVVVLMIGDGRLAGAVPQQDRVSRIGRLLARAYLRRPISRGQATGAYVAGAAMRTRHQDHRVREQRVVAARLLLR